MAYTRQEAALQTVRTIFGKSGWTEDTVNYRRVGCLQFTAIGDTWNNAIEALKAKVPNATK